MLVYILRAAAPAADPGSKYGGLATFGYLLKQGNLGTNLRNMKRLRHRQIIQETWEAIARKRSRTTIPVEKCVENTAGPTISQRKPVYEYICPHCETQVRSTVTDGQVDAKQQHCGVRFRVRGGTVIQSFFTHQCPSCLTEVQSTKRFGRIRVAHKKPNGKRCGTKCWQVVCSGTKDTT